MRLMEILNEITVLESKKAEDAEFVKLVKENCEAGESLLSESEEAELLEGKMSPASAVKAIKQMEKGSKKAFEHVRKTVIAAYSANNIGAFKELLKNKKYAKIASDYITLIGAAHGGANKVKSKAANKSFFDKAFGLTVDAATA